MGDRGAVLVSGATGLIGATLCEQLASAGERIRALSRRAAPLPTSTGGAREAIERTPWDGRDPGREACEGVRAIVHLAGEPIFRAGPVTAAHLSSVRESRIESTRAFVSRLRELPQASRPEVFVCASAVGYYGRREDPERELTEDAPAGTGFTAELCRDWEHEAAEAEALGLRVVSLRLGIVLSPSGGALAMMALPFRFGLGGRIGDGRQWVPWIAREDAVCLVQHAIDTPGLRGPVNAVSPNPVTNAELTAALGRVLGRPTLLPVPEFAVRFALRSLAGELLDSRRAIPSAALASDFAFECPTIDEALARCLGPGA